MMGRLKLSTRLRSLFALCAVSCLGGMVAGAAVGDELWGQRGGAIAVAISFVALFQTRSDGLRTFRLLTSGREKVEQAISEIHAELRGERAAPSTPRSAEYLASALAARLKSDAADVRLVNRWLAACSVLGTLVWGFGDLVVRALIEWHISMS